MSQKGIIKKKDALIDWIWEHRQTTFTVRDVYKGTGIAEGTCFMRIKYLYKLGVIDKVGSKTPSYKDGRKRTIYKVNFSKLTEVFKDGES